MNSLDKKLCAKLHEVARCVLENRHSEFSSGDVVTSIFGGSSGVVLFLYHYYGYSKDSAYKDAGEELLQNAFRAVNASNDVCFDYGYGITGLYAVLFHLLGAGLITRETVDYDCELDDIVDSKIQQNMELGNYEFFTGVCGYLLFLTFQAKYYGVSRLSLKERIAEMCFMICKKMEEDPDYNPARDKEDGHVLLSIPHGVCGWLSLLCKIKELNLDSEYSEKLQEYMALHLLPFVTLDEKFSYFPIRYDDPVSHDEKGASRLAWCYGDMGCCLSLLRYAKVTHNGHLRDTLLQMLKRTSRRRDLLQNRVYGAGLCHGSSGVAHMFDLLYRIYGLLDFKEASDYWHSQTLEFGKPGSNYSGYKNVRICNGESIYSDNISLLGGVSGIGLSMISRLSGDHTWDELFLIDIT